MINFKEMILPSFVDYPGKIAVTLFTQGCNYRCPWCYNKELIELGDAKITPQEVVKKVKKYSSINGICITGGEPAIHGSNLIEAISYFKEEIKLPIKLDTNGFFPFMLETLLYWKLIDYVAMDIKATEDQYMKAVGLEQGDNTVMIGKIKESIRIIKEYNVEHRFRTTFGHKFTKEEDLKIIEKEFGVKVYPQKYRDII